MKVYRRRLPHVYETEQPVFLTWRLRGSLPQHRPSRGGPLPSGQAFATLDSLLDEAQTGARYLCQPAIADLVVEALRYNANILRHYELHAFVVMPNHVHALVTAAIPLPKLTKSLKGITAKRANAVLGLTGRPFWQQESYDQVVRNKEEFEKISSYIEEHPVRAGLVEDAAEYRWSSARRATRGSQTVEGDRLHTCL
jgi:REP element-mobilizing transposase RayT